MPHSWNKTIQEIYNLNDYDEKECDFCHSKNIEYLDEQGEYYCYDCDKYMDEPFAT